MYYFYLIYCYILFPFWCLFAGVFIISQFVPAEWRNLMKDLLWEVKK